MQIPSFMVAKLLLATGKSEKRKLLEAHNGRIAPLEGNVPGHHVQASAPEGTHVP